MKKIIESQKMEALLYNVDEIKDKTGCERQAVEKNPFESELFSDWNGVGR